LGISIEDREAEASRRLVGALDPSMIDALLADAKITGTPLDGVDGLLNQMTKAVIERALAAEITHDLGYEREDPAGVGPGNSRNGFATKTIATTNGPITIDVPRDRNGTFEPKIVPKRARRLGQIDEPHAGPTARAGRRLDGEGLSKRQGQGGARQAGRSRTRQAGTLGRRPRRRCDGRRQRSLCAGGGARARLRDDGGGAAWVPGRRRRASTGTWAKEMGLGKAIAH